MKSIQHFSIIAIMSLIISCGNDSKKNTIHINQLNSDNSNNYKYIFKDTIEKEKRKQERDKRDPFAD